MVSLVRASLIVLAVTSAFNAPCSSGASVTAPVVPKVSNRALVVAELRPDASNTRRSKFDGAWTSMLTDADSTAWRRI